MPWSCPLIVERSLEAYGFYGAFLIMGGLSLNAIVCGATVRPPDSGKDRANIQLVSRSKLLRQNKKKDAKYCDQSRHELLTNSCKECGECLNGTGQYAYKNEQTRQRNSDSNDCSTESESTCRGNNSSPGSEVSKWSPHYSEVFETKTEETALVLEEDSNHSFKHAVDKLVPGTGPVSFGSSFLANIHARLKSTLLFKEPWFAFMLPASFVYYYTYYAWLLFLVPNAEWLGIPPVTSCSSLCSRRRLRHRRPNHLPHQRPPQIRRLLSLRRVVCIVNGDVLSLSAWIVFLVPKCDSGFAGRCHLQRRLAVLGSGEAYDCRQR